VLIEFVEDDGTHPGTSRGGRRWTASRVFSGVRLELRDEGDVTATRGCSPEHAVGPGGSGPVAGLRRSTLLAQPGSAECDGKGRAGGRRRD